MSMSGIFEGILFCSDYDGTLCAHTPLPGKASGIPEENLTALRRFMAEGGLFTLCTGRRGRSAPMDIVPNAPIIGLSGTEIYNPASDTTEALFPLGEEWRQITLDFLRKETAARLNVGKISVVTDRDAYPFLIEDPAAAAFVNTCAETVCKIMFYFRSPRTDADPVPPEVRERCRGIVNPLSNGTNAFQITALHAHKGTGVRYLKEKTGARLLVCAGDWDGDIPMLREADIGYAVGNAHESAKAAADRITVRAEDGAIARIIEELEVYVRSKR